MVALRGLRTYRRTPQVVAFGIAKAVAFLLIFRYVFGGAVATGSVRYVDFMLPGLLTAGTLFSGMGTAAAVAQDRAEGFFDRLRSLPMPRGAVVTGRVLADTVLIATVLPATTAVGFLVGFRVHNGWWSAVAAYALLVLFAFAFLWVFVTIGLIAANAQVAQAITFLVLPVSFAWANPRNIPATQHSTRYLIPGSSRGYASRRSARTGCIWTSGWTRPWSSTGCWLGATVRDRLPGRTVMANPEGHEFCVFGVAPP
jgi:ABC-type transport system involved in cytochrome c biogenesis permease component